MNTKLLRENDLIGLTRKNTEIIGEICKAGSAYMLGGNFRDPVQILLMRGETQRDPLIAPIIESSAIQAEKRSAGSGELFLRLIASEIDKDISRRSIGETSDSEWEDIINHINRCSIPARKRDLKELFKGGSETFQRITKEAFDFLKADDKVLVRKSATNETCISAESGYTFSGFGIDKRFLSKGSWIRKNVKVIIIDGIIEKVSEIHKLLEDVSRAKTPCLIFCIDALPDISETLVRNFHMGNLDVFLVKVPVDEMNVNSMVDLGTIFGTEPVSAMMGETVSSGIERQQCTADRIVITNNQVSIEKKESRTQVHSHVTALRRRIEEDINLSIILEPRIRNLSSSVIKIEIGIDDQKKDPNIVERLDRALRSLPTIFKRGFIEKNDFKEFSTDKICLLFEHNDVVSAETAIQSIKVFLSTRDAIRSAAIGIRSI